MLTRKPKTHNYTKLLCDRDYSFESIGEGSGYMTGQGSGVKKGDYLLLRMGGDRVYQVEEIDYYSNLRDMWMALLKASSD